MKFLFYSLLLFFTLQNQAQNPLYKRFFESAQSTVGSVYDVYQDKRGFLWLGTESGLLRFDGKSVILFAADGAFGKAVTNLFEDPTGNIYCQNFSGQFFKSIKNRDSLIFVTEMSNYGNIKQANLVDDSLVGFVDKQSIAFYNLNSKRIKRTYINQNEIQPSTSKQKTSHYTIILPDQRQLISFSNNGQRFSKKFSSKNVVFFHVNVSKHDFILGKNPPFVVEDIEAQSSIKLKEIASSIIINGMVLIDSTIAILTSDGVYFYDTKFKYKRHYFAKESISCFLKDKQGNYWFGTLNNGLLLVSQPATASFLNNKHFTAIGLKKNELLAGTSENEIYQIDLSNNFLSKLVYKDSAIHEVREIYYNEVRDELLFSNQQLNILKDHHLQKIVASVNDIKSIHDQVYLLSKGSCVSFFLINDTDSLYKRFESKDRPYSGKQLALTKRNIRVNSSVMMGNNKVVSATSNGLLQFSKEGSHEILYKQQKIKAVSLAKLNEDSILIATPQNGVLLLTGSVIQEYIKPSDLAFNNVYMLKVFEKKVFVVTYKSLEVYNHHKQKIAEQLLSDGYHGCDLVDFTFKNDQIYVANVNGVIASPLYNFRRNDIAPEIYITKTSINGAACNFENLKELSYNSYYFDFSFSIIDYRGLETTKAYYKVNNGEWILTSENRILLTALEPNAYKIQLKAVNERGIETKAPAILLFTIKPPFYKTWWFITSLFIGIAILIYLVFKNRINSIKTIASKTI